MSLLSTELLATFSWGLLLGEVRNGRADSRTVTSFRAGSRPKYLQSKPDGSNSRGYDE